MNQLVQITLDQELQSNPSKIAQMIVDLAREIEDCKEDLDKIKDRGVIKRLFSNNTKDLANTIIKQNDTMSLFLNVVQTLIMMNLGNAFMLQEIQNEITSYKGLNGDFENQFVSMAERFIENSLQAASRQQEKINNLERQVENIRRVNRLGFGATLGIFLVLIIVGSL